MEIIGVSEVSPEARDRFAGTKVWDLGKAANPHGIFPFLKAGLDPVMIVNDS